MKTKTLPLTALLACLILFSQAQTTDTTKTTTMKIGLTNVYVNNPDKAFKFYTEVIGFVKVLYIPESSLAIVASPQDPEGTALLLEPNNNPIAKTYQEELYEAGLPAIVFITEDIHKEYDRLKKLGVVFKKEPTTTAWGIEAIFDDKCGNFIQVQQTKE